jgi:hypothetical protein
MFMCVASFSPEPADLKGFGGAAIEMNEEGVEPTARPETFHMITINVRIHLSEYQALDVYGGEQHSFRSFFDGSLSLV